MVCVLWHKHAVFLCVWCDHGQSAKRSKASRCAVNAAFETVGCNMLSVQQTEFRCVGAHSLGGSLRRSGVYERVDAMQVPPSPAQSPQPPTDSCTTTTTTLHTRPACRPLPLCIPCLCPVCHRSSDVVPRALPRSPSRALENHAAAACHPPVHPSHQQWWISSTSTSNSGSGRASQPSHYSAAALPWQ